MNRFLAPLGFLIAAVSLIILNTVSAADNPFKLTNAEITDKTSGVDASITSFTDTNIATDVTFYHLDDSVTYAVTLANTSENNLIISSISDNNTNPYITYLYDSNAGTKILAGETLELEVVAKYSVAIPDVTARTQNLNVKFIVNYEIEEDITVPDTNTTEPTAEPTDSTETPTDTTSVPDTGTNTHSAAKRTKSVDPVLIGFIILGAILLLIGLLRSKTSISTKVLVLAILGSLGVTATIKATSEQLTFEFDSNINIKSLLSVTYSVDGEEHTEVIPYGGTLPLEDQEKEGYDFDGWQDEDGNTINNTTPITDDIKISATWTAISYTISYSYEPNLANLQPTMACNDATLDLRGNYTIEDADITIPMLVNLEENNANTCLVMDGRVGYRFLGWKENGEGEIIENPVIAHGSTGDKNYVGIFRQAHLTVYIDPDGGNETAPGPFTLAYQEHLDLSPYHFTKTNYTQTGWNYAEDFINEYSIVDDATITIKPTWEHNDYTLHFDYGNSTCSRVDEVHTFAESYNIPRHSDSSDPCVPRGYYFGGWTDVLADKDIHPEGVTGPLLTINENDQVYLKAKWLPNAYMLYLNANGSSYSPASFKESYICDSTNGDRSSCRKDLYFDTEIALPTAVEMTREGYTLNGWNDTNNIHYVPGATIKGLSDDGTTINMTADWSANLNTASFYSADGNTLLTTCKMYTDETLKTVLAKDDCNPISRPGYYVERWTDTPNGTDYVSTNNFRTHSDVSFYIHTEHPNKFNVIFHANYTDANPTEQSIQVTYDSDAIIQSNIFARMGYKIDSYNTLANGEGDSYNVGANIGTLTTERNATVDLYAQWSLNTYTIVFHANDDDVTGEMNNLEALYNTPVSLTKNNYKKSGYVFTQWNTQADGSGIGFDDEATVLNMASEGTIDLYAQWRLAVAQFKPGLYVNNQMRVLSNSGIVYGKSLTNTTPMSNNSTYQDSTKILAIKRSATPPDFDHMNVINPWAEGSEGYNPDFEKLNDWNIVSTANSLDPIYIWYVPNDANNTNGILYYWSADVDPQLNADSYRMFRTLSNVSEIDYQYFDTTGVENIREMFSNTKITSADLSQFDTSHLTEMRSLFSNCTALTSVTFGNSFDTSQVQYFSNIFANNRALTSIDISMFDTRNAISMAGMFSGTNVLASINYGENFKTDNVRDFSSMYNGALALPDLEIVKTFNTSSATNMDSMFKDCQAITEIDVTGFNTANVTDMGSMFMNLKNISSLDIQNFDTRNVEDMSYLFRGLKNITTHPLVGENFKTTSLKDMHGMYRDYSDSLTSIDLTGYDTSHVTDMSELFMENPQLTSLNITSFTTGEVANFSYMFDHCSGLRTVPEVATFDTANATNMAGLFRGMKVQSLDLSHFNTEKVRSMAFMFASLETETDLDFSSFRTPALTNLDTTFQNFKTPYKLDLSTFNTENVTIFQYLFKSINAPYIDISGFNMSNSNNHQQMFHGMTNEILDLGKFESNGKIISGNYLMSNSSTKTVFVDPDYVPNFGDVLDIVQVVGGQGTTYMGHSGVYGRIDHAEDGGEPGYFTDRSKLNVYFNANGGNGTMENQIGLQSNTDVVLRPNQFTISGIGRVFGGWNTEPDGSGTHYDDQGIINARGQVVLYAQWGATPYTVIFDKNEPTGIAVSGTMENISREYGERFNLPANQYSANGYAFLGWNSKADGKGKHYNNEQEVVNLDIDGEVTLYAEWKEMIAMFDTGTNVRNIIGSLVTPDHTIRKIKESATAPDLNNVTYKLLSLKDSYYPIYGWYDEDTETIYYWAEPEKLFLNPSSAAMFQSLLDVTEIDTTNFDTSRVTTMHGMFGRLQSLMYNEGDKKLTHLDLSNWDTSNVTDMRYMFYGCNSLESITLGDGWDTSNVTNMASMFQGNNALGELDTANWNTEKVTDMSNMFNGCSSLTSLDVTDWKTGEVTTMASMFAGCSSLTTLDVTDWDTAKVTTMANMFGGASWNGPGCESLTTLDLSHWVTDNVTNMSTMFQGCSGLTSLDVSHFNTEKVTNMAGMFGGTQYKKGCESLTSLNLSSFTTDQVTNMSNMFRGMKSISTLNLTHFNTQNVTDMSGMFAGMTNLTSVDVSHFNTENVTTMAAMFSNTTSLGSVDITNFNTSKVKSVNSMFISSAISELDLSNFDGRALTDVQMFAYNVTNLATIYATENSSFEGASGSAVFFNTLPIKGGAGTKYEYYASLNASIGRIDDPDSGKPGYFTPKDSRYIRYNANEGEGVMTSHYVNVSSVSTDKLHANEFTREGFDFMGWNTAADGSGTPYANNQAMNGTESSKTPLVLYAQWRSKTITITFDKNDDRATGEMPTQTQASGDVTLNTNQFFRGEGYAFGGWNTMPDGSGTHYDDGETIEDAFGLLTLYAEWGISPYTITFDKNDEAATGATEPMTLNYGERAKLNLSGFTKEHYAQIGWNTKADGSGKHYEDGESVVNVINDGEITLYAEWVEAIATLMPGKEINGAMKRVSNAGSNYEHPNRIIRKFERTDTMPTNVTGLNIAMSDSNLPVYIWYDGHDNVNTVYYYSRAEKIYLNEDISYMFSNFSKLESADLTQFEAPRITAMENLFNQCASLTSFDISNIDTSEVTDMTGMFSFTRSLQTIELPTFNTENVTNMSWMFSKTGATTIDISTFDTGNVTNMSNMLRSYEPGEGGITPSVHTIYVGDKFTTANVTSSNYIFRTQSILVGGAGTASATSGNGDKFIFARLDDPDNGKPGYLSMKGARYVRYNKNGADGTEEMTSHYLTNSGSLKANIFTNTGKTFTGWNTAADGSGDEYTDGQLMSDLVESKEPLTLYAQWLGEGFNGTISLEKQYSSDDVLQISSTMSGGYVGAAYFNPADLNEKCTPSSANVADKEAKTGCMKWYIYDDSGDNYKMILDHNTTKMLAANSSNKNSNLQALTNRLATDTTDWDNTKLTIDIMSAQEVADIADTGFNQSGNPNNTGGGWYTLGVGSKKGSNAYGWLFDYSQGCEDFGCDYEVSGSYGHWLKTPVSGDTKKVWVVNYMGRLTFAESKLSSWGIRPIITVSKTDVTAE